MTIIVTGAAGFIGSNLIHALNKRGERHIIAVDDLTQSNKFHHIVDADITDYFDKTEFLAAFTSRRLGKIRALFHQGACSDTMETDGRYMMENNFSYSRALLLECLSQRTPFLYASSAAVYGDSKIFLEKREYEQPMNIYGYSKFLFDQFVRRVLANATSQIAGFRYFNVYGPRESHKGRMASVAYHHFNQFRELGCVKLFGEYNGYAAGTQKRDFISVEDVVRVNLHFFDYPQMSGIFNLGTGVAQPFNDIAVSVINTIREKKGELLLTLNQMVQQKLIEYIPFPEDLKGKYQCYTEADISQLRTEGYSSSFLNVNEGVGRYVRWLIG